MVPKENRGIELRETPACELSSGTGFPCVSAARGFSESYYRLSLLMQHHLMFSRQLIAFWETCFMNDWLATVPNWDLSLENTL